MDLDAVWAKFIGWCTANDVIIPRGVCLSNRHTTSRSPSVKRPSRKETFGVYQVITKTFCDKSTQTDDFLICPVKSERREPPIIGVSDKDQKPDLSLSLPRTSVHPADDTTATNVTSDVSDDVVRRTEGESLSDITGAEISHPRTGTGGGRDSDGDYDEPEPFEPLETNFQEEEIMTKTVLDQTSNFVQPNTRTENFKQPSTGTETVTDQSKQQNTGPSVVPCVTLHHHSTDPNIEITPPKGAISPQRQHLNHISPSSTKCKEIFVSADDLVRDVTCSLCDKSYSARSRLKEHFLRSHISVYAFSCVTCKRSFKQQKEVKSHQCCGYERYHHCPRCNWSSIRPLAVDMHTSRKCKVPVDDTTVQDKYLASLEEFEKRHPPPVKVSKTKTTTTTAATAGTEEDPKNVTSLPPSSETGSDLGHDREGSLAKVDSVPATDTTSLTPSSEIDDDLQNEDKSQDREDCSPSTDMTSLPLPDKIDALEDVLEDDSCSTPFKCYLCIKSYSGRNRLKEHVISAHAPVYAITCDKCGYSCKLVKNLYRHQRRNCSGQTRYIRCDRCNISHTTAEQMEFHKKNKCPYTTDDGVTHDVMVTYNEFVASFESNVRRGSTGRNPAVPDKDKPQVFSKENGPTRKRKIIKTPDSTRRKKRAKISGTPKCPLCARICKTHGDVKEHYFSNHVPLYPYTCSGCDKTFKVKRFQRNHEVRSCNNTQQHYRCERCNKSYSQTELLESHLQKHCPYPDTDTRDLAQKLADAVVTFQASLTKDERSAPPAVEQGLSGDPPAIGENPSSRPLLAPGKSPASGPLTPRTPASPQSPAQNQEHPVKSTGPVEHQGQSLKTAARERKQPEVRESPENRSVILYPRMEAAVHDKRVSYSCLTCDRRFTQRSALRVHYHASHVDVYMYNCGTCHAAFLHHGQRNNHQPCNNRKAYRYKCDLCLRTFTEESVLTAHQSVPCTTNDTPPGERTAHQSDRSATNDLPPGERYKNYMDHFEATVPKVRVIHKVKDKFKEKDATANSDGITTGSDVIKRRRKKKGTPGWPRFERGGDPQPCPICNKTIRTYETWLRHKNYIHVTERRHICHVCGKRFKTTSDVTSHMRTHALNKPSYECEQCGKRYTSSTALRTHARLHTGVGVRMCDICGKRYTSDSELIVHMRSHTGERPFRCEVCQKSFATRSKVNTHMMIHLGVTRHQCPHCPKAFRQRAHYNNHIRTHTGDKPFSCSYCDYRCNVRHNLTKHVKTVHKF